MDATIVIVTRNRARHLAATLLVLSQLDYGGGAYEVIVADNGSTDATEDVCDTYARTLPNFRYIFDPRPGQIVGWHSALAVAQGEFICFIDDDTRPQPGWLAAAREAFADREVGLVTGRITPEFEGAPPDWRRDLILTYEGGIWSAQLGLLDFGDAIKEIPAAFVWGRNFLVRRSAMIAAGGFHPGGMPRDLFHFTGDGDMGAGKAIEAMGHKVIYHPEAAVTNLFQAHQADAGDFHRWIFGEGLVTSYIHLRHLAAAEPGAPPDELPGMVRAAVGDAIAKIGHGYLKSLTNLPGDLRRVVDTAGRQGFEAHLGHFARDPAFRDWVLRPDYLDIDACYSHPDLIREADRVGPAGGEGVG